MNLLAFLRGSLKRTTSLAIFLVFLIASLARTQTVSNWLGGTGNWSDGLKWSSAVPDGGTFDVRIDNSNAAVSSVTMDSSRTVGRLTIDAGDSLSLANNVTFTVAAGGFAGSGAIFNNGTLSIN